MAQGWLCPGGHSGDGSLPLPACPICGLPIAMVYTPDPPAEPAPLAKEPTPEPELTLVGPAAAALSMTDLAFLQAEEPPEALEETDWLPIPMPFLSGATPFPVGETMLPTAPESPAESPPAARVEMPAAPPEPPVTETLVLEAPPIVEPEPVAAPIAAEETVVPSALAELPPVETPAVIEPESGATPFAADETMWKPAAQPEKSQLQKIQEDPVVTPEPDPAAMPLSGDETMLKPGTTEPTPAIVATLPEPPPAPPMAETLVIEAPRVVEPEPSATPSIPDFVAVLEAPTANGTPPETVSLPPSSPPTTDYCDSPTTYPRPESGAETIVKPSSAPQAEATQATPDFPSGYEILGVLGRGGMGVVYKAKQKGLGRLVALKMILAGGHATPEELTRFKTEAEAVARLQHPNIVQVFDTGLRDGRPFFSLEYCEGGSLQQKLDGVAMPPREAAALIETLARAMHFAHQRGIVHRDLKPANILLTADGTPKITDFGLAKRLEDDSGHTGTEAVLGTPTYMAPEQASGQTRQVGPGADIYSLGAVFYDLITGRPPFRGATALDTLQMVQSAEPIPPKQLQPGLPADLQTICLKCLEKSPAARYTTAQDLADDVRRFLDDQPILARPATTWERARKWARRRPAAAALVAIAAVTPFLITGASLAVAGALLKKNADIEQASATIVEKNNELASREKDLVATSDRLRETVRKLTEHEKELQAERGKLQESNTSLREALDKVIRAEEDSEQSFLAALKASDDLLLLARKEFRKPGFESARQGLLQRAVVMCQRFTARPGNSPAALLRAARAHRLVGDLESTLGSAKSAVKNFEESVGFYEKLIESGKEIAGVDLESELLETMTQLWGVLEGIDGKRADKLLGAIEGRILRLTPERRKQPTYRRLAGMWRLNRAVQHQLRDRPQHARDDYDQAITELRSLADQPDALLELARVHVNRATLLVAGRERLTSKGGLYVPPAANLRQAVKDCEEALVLLKSAPREDVAVATVVGQAYRNLGLALSLSKEPESAREKYEEAVAVFDGLAKRVPLNPDFRHLLAIAQGDLGTHLLRLGRAEQGTKLLGAGRATLKQLAASFRDTPVYRLDLARLATSEGLSQIGAADLGGAEAPLTEAVTLLEGVIKDQPQRADVRQYLLIGIRNLIFCHDRLARLADLRFDRRSAARHVGELARLRQKYEKALPPLAPDATLVQKLTRYWEQFTAREELASTLRAQANVMETRNDHEGAARCVAEMRPLLAADWSGWVESAALLSRCISLARDDPRLQGPEQQRLAKRYGQQALEILAPLARRGEPELSARLEGRDFDPLRRLYKEDFRRLVEGVGRSSKSGM